MTALSPEQTYPSDLTNRQWDLIAPLVAQGPGRGRRRIVDIRRVVNALLYVDRTGCQWRYLPKEFPPKNTVYHYFETWTWDGTFQRVNDALRAKVRVAAGRNAEPSAGSIDSQSVKSTEMGGERGFDGEKLVTGRKRHIVVDTEGNLLVVQVHAANVSDRAGARPLLTALHEGLPTVRHPWADGGYSGELVGWAKTQLGITIELVNKLAGQATFVPLPRRWVVERSFAWAGRNRRLAKDFERYSKTTEGWMYLASAHLLAKRLTRSP